MMTLIGNCMRAMAVIAPRTVAAPGHVALHREHIVGRFEREPAAIERHAFADQAQLRRPAAPPL